MKKTFIFILWSLFSVAVNADVYKRQTHYINKIGKERFLEERIDVGLISPYKAQVQYLRQLIRCV